MVSIDEILMMDTIDIMTPDSLIYLEQNNNNYYVCYITPDTKIIYLILMLTKNVHNISSPVMLHKTNLIYSYYGG